MNVIKEVDYYSLSVCINPNFFIYCFPIPFPFFFLLLLSGIVKNIGVSNYGETLLLRANEKFSASKVPLASNQINYSLLYRTKTNAQRTVNVGKEMGIQTLASMPLGMLLILPLLLLWPLPPFIMFLYSATKKGNINNISFTIYLFLSIHIFIIHFNYLFIYQFNFLLPLAMGLLTGKSIDSKKASRSVFELTNLKSYEKDIRQLTLKLNEIANNRGKTIPQVALNYIISKGVLPIAGSNSKQHLLDNLGAQSWHLNRNEMNALDSLSDEACEIRSFEGAGFKRSNEKFVGYGFESWDLK